MQSDQTTTINNSTSSLKGKKISKILKLGGNREIITDSVELNFTSEKDFSFTGKYFYDYDSDNYEGDYYKAKYYSGSGVYEIISSNQQNKETVAKLIFSSFIKEVDEKKEEKANIILIAHVLDVYGTDVYFEANEFFPQLTKENLFTNLWQKEIDMLVKCGLHKEEAYKRVFDYFQSIKDKSSYMYSYSFCVEPDLIFEIYNASFPNNCNNLSNMHFLVKDFFEGHKLSVYEFCAMWKNAGYDLKNFIKQNNLGAHTEQLKKKIIDYFGKNLPANFVI